MFSSPQTSQFGHVRSSTASLAARAACLGAERLLASRPARLGSLGRRNGSGRLRLGPLGYRRCLATRGPALGSGGGGARPADGKCSPLRRRWDGGAGRVWSSGRARLWLRQVTRGRGERRRRERTEVSGAARGGSRRERAEVRGAAGVKSRDERPGGEQAAAGAAGRARGGAEPRSYVTLCDQQG